MLEICMEQFNTNLMERLKGKVAIITGAASGMGTAHARMFVAEGARVVITDVNETAGKALEKELGADHALFIKHDVSQSADWKHVVAITEDKFGPITVLVNNAGIAKVQPIDEVTETAYQQIIDVNQLSVFLGMLHVKKSMRKAKGGAIVNISSISGLQAMAGTLAYTASKFAVRGMTKVAALELAKDNIRVNSVHPGLIYTPLLEEMPDDVIKQMAAVIPLGHMGDPSEVSQVVVFLASDEFSYATGAEFVIDGGVTSKLAI